LAQNADNEISATSLKISLLCPVNFCTLLIRIPLFNTVNLGKLLANAVKFGEQNYSWTDG